MATDADDPETPGTNEASTTAHSSDARDERPRSLDDPEDRQSAMADTIEA